MQKRYGEYMTHITDDLVRQLILASSRYVGQVLDGGHTVTVSDVNEVTISAGRSCTDEGVLIVSEDDQKLHVPTTAAANDYTVVIRHELSNIGGGSPAVPTLITGLQTVYGGYPIVAWIQYPGGSVPMDDAFITPAAQEAPNPLLLDAWDRAFPGAEIRVPSRDMALVSTGVNLATTIVHNDVLDDGVNVPATKVANSGGATQTHTLSEALRVPLVNGVIRPFTAIEAWYFASSNTSSSLILTASGGVTQEIVMTPGAHTSEWVKYSATITPAVREAQREGAGVMTVKAVMNVFANKEARLSLIRLSSRPYPA